MSTDRARAHSPVEKRPRVEFKQDFDGNLYMLAPADRPEAMSWTVIVHPHAGAVRTADLQTAAEVPWYDDPPPPDRACWFIHDRDCLIEIRTPDRPNPFWIRRTQPSFGRWRVRRRGSFSS